MQSQPLRAWKLAFRACLHVGAKSPHNATIPSEGVTTQTAVNTIHKLEGRGR